MPFFRLFLLPADECFLSLLGHEGSRGLFFLFFLTRVSPLFGEPRSGHSQTQGHLSLVD